MSTAKIVDGICDSDRIKTEARLQQLLIETRLLTIGDHYKGSRDDKLRAEARDFLKVDSVKDFNYAFSGQARVGKSTLINCLRHVEDVDKEAAEVHIVECTEKIAPYRFDRDLSHLVLWDMPGAGTVDHPQDTYFYDKRLYVFDCLLVVMSEGMFAVDIEIGRLTQEFEIPVLYVRNKAMAALATMRELHKEITDEDKLIGKTKSVILENMKANLSKAGVTTSNENLFVIEAHAYRTGNVKFDEIRLMQRITELAKPRSKH